MDETLATQRWSEIELSTGAGEGIRTLDGKFVLNGTDRPFGDHSGAKEKVTPAIPPWTLHDLRRSLASGLQWLGIAPHIVELALNHRSGTFSGVAGIYQRHRYAKEVREAFELWSRHIEALTTKEAVAA